MARPTFEQVMTGVVGGVLLAAFAAVVVAQLLIAKEPPRLADLAPTAPPQVFCEGSTATPTLSAQPTGMPASQATSPAPVPSPLASSPAGVSGSGVAATCRPNEIAFSPQYRGAFDPVSRLNTLLAVVTPLVTSIVAFYFGQKIGSSEGRAATAEANQAITQAQHKVTTNKKLDEADKSELVDELEAARIIRR